MARPEHLRGGRKKLALEERPVSQTVRLSPETADLVCVMAIRRGISVYAFLGGIIERVFAKQKIAQCGVACYGAKHQSSTLGAVLSESPSTRARVSPSAASDG